MRHRHVTLRHRVERIGLAIALACTALLCWAATSSAAPPATRTVYAAGTLVPIPASIPHEDGDMVDRRILPNLRWLAQRYPIYVTDGYSGPLPSGEHAGCDNCHTHGSDHYNGLAVDIVPVGGGTKCDASWAAITRLALWAEPVQGEPAPPFRWVGYDGDAGHGCGHHLHLSWNHAVAAEFELAEWVEVFAVGPIVPSETGGEKPRKIRRAAPKPQPGSSGGVSTVRSGGLAPRID
ncbi:MAG TPA: hypothetical protein VFI03_08350 [Solirubrobacterales bacterium]|nr:hypothetical protein [Solirubrobacterales bacterium]